ncbi:MAG: hypothetical protein RIM84_27175 [Alphaproteobacteria bacterium]
MSETLTIPARYRGPPDSGNGGYVAGRFATFVGNGPVEVTLRAPTPLETAMDVVRDGDEWRLLHGDKLIAQARPAPLDLDVPDLPPMDETVEATARGGSPYESDYGKCFVCGKGLAAHLGLNMHPGWLPERQLVSALWRPDAAFAGADGKLDPAFAWGALDCPGGFAAGNGISGSTMYLTGRMTGLVEGEVRAGEDYVVTGWVTARDGRKVTSGTAVSTPDGQVVAKALSLWIEIRSPF